MIKAEVRYSAEHYRQLAKCRNKLLLFILTGVAGIIVLQYLFLLALIKTSGEGFPEDFGIYTALTIFIVITVVFNYLSMYVLFPKRAEKTEREKFGSAPVHFTLDDEKIVAEQKGDGFNEYIERPYSIMEKAVETDRYFLLFITRSTAFIIGKNDITQGSPDEMRKLLQAKFGKRMKRK